MHPVVLIVPKAHRFTQADVAVIALEIDIIYWLAENLSEGGVGEMVTRKGRCINTRIGILYIKTGCCTHAGLVSFAFKHGLLFYAVGVLMKWKENDEPEKEK